MPRIPVAPAPGRHAVRHDLERLAGHLPALREALERQRTFRREQLAQLAGQGRSAAPSQDAGSRGAASALHEVHDLIGAGARRALADTEVALERMSAGTYGRCRTCGTGIPLQLLTAIPATTLCLACQQRRDAATRSPDPSSPGVAGRRQPGRTRTGRPRPLPGNADGGMVGRRSESAPAVEEVRRAQ